MKNNLSRNDVSTNLNGKTTSFGIGQSAHAFEILSKNIYSDIPRAIVRELICNAVDANLRGKNNDPIQVYMPTSDEPTFKVVDRGVGMTHEDVTEVYTTYFMSSKQNNNVETGYLGIGAKSPFAYTQQFAIKTARKGKENTYIAFKNSEGLPELTLVHTQNVNYSGTEIEVPINTRDFQTFNVAALQTLIFLKKMPTIERGLEELQQVTYKVVNNTKGKNTNWEKYLAAHEYLYSKTEITYESDAHDSCNVLSNVVMSMNNDTCGIVMGGVFYSVNSQNIKDDRPTTMFEFPVTRYNQRKIRHVPMGSVEFQPSRETLNYSDTTIKYLRTEFAKTYDTAKNSLQSCTLAKLPASAKKMSCVNTLLTATKNDDAINTALRTISNDVIKKTGRFFAGTCTTSADKTFIDAIRYKESSNTSLSYIASFLLETAQELPKNAVVLTDKMVESLQDSFQQREQIRLYKHIQTKLDLVEENASFLLMSQSFAQIALQLNPAYAIVDISTVKGERKERGPINKTVRGETKSFLSINGNAEYSLEDIKELIKKGRYDTVAWELFTGSGPNETDGKPTWNEYVNLSKIRAGEVVKTKSTHVTCTNKGFTSQVALFAHSLRSILTQFDDSYIAIPSTTLFVALRWKDFVSNEVWTEPHFVQTMDYLADVFGDVSDVMTTKLSNIEIRSSGMQFSNSDLAAVSKILTANGNTDNVFNKYTIEQENAAQRTTLGDAERLAEKIRTYKNTYESHCCSNNKTKYVAALQTTFETMRQEIKIKSDAADSTKNDFDTMFFTAYPMLTMVVRNWNAAVIADYVEQVGK